ncbi:alpha/beta hydrolase [Telmatospirillum sp.]|uniref:alpha/beta hydrolase n=1 Tax=Telmatospirillum sp. TaxID=2079197 RepID=UPI00283E8B69|nr:alpha/beta hydrolase [Telmatospirillum sp.]MDR3438675.1 alpha/beta hydrolase [Telmatospirillum sp.]
MKPLTSETVINLWPDDGVGPGSERVSVQLTVTERDPLPHRRERVLTGITRPTMTAYLPDCPNGSSVIIAPGGGYARIMLDKEGAEMARWLNSQGVTAFVMHYRLPGEGHVDAANVPLQDAQRAVRIVRRHAVSWGLDPHRLGMLGSSSAGHMATWLAGCFDKTVYAAKDDADQYSARPDFLLLLYPVVTMEAPFAHAGSRQNLLGTSPTDEEIAAHSTDRLVRPDTPPCFMVLADNDETVPSENAIRYYQGLRRAGVSGELHVFREGGHGFALDDVGDLPVAQWPQLAIAWMKSIGVLDQ